MRKTYSTAELLRKLDIGQKAEMIQPLQDIIVKRTANGIIVLKDAMSSKHIETPLPMTHIVLSATWHIERKSISFQTAMTYIHEGRTVYCEYDGRVPIKYDSLDDLIHIAEAIHGTWYLED